MKKRYPFKFLDAYTREDSDFYFGRTDEINALYKMIFQSDILLVYGASGTGKSSLIQCGLASKFQSHDWLALNIRRIGNLNESFDRALQDAGGTLDTKTADNFDWLDEDPVLPAPAKNISALSRRFRAIYLKHFKPVYLIFDQFEELYILGSQDEQRQFIKTVQEILRVEQPVKIIVIIREEFLGHLYEFERAVPELLRKKLRVEPMNLDKVKTVIQSVGAQPTGNVRLQPGEEANITEAIFEKIRGDEKTLHIPLPYLQVFLDKLYLQITNDKTRQSEAVFSLQALSEIGDLGDVLRNFLDEQVRDIASKLGQQKEILWKTLSPFVTLDGTKEPLSEAQLANKLPDAPPGFVLRALQSFVTGRILRFSEATQRYEIAHDSLAKQIHAKRSDEEIVILEAQRLVKSQTSINEAAREYFTERQLLFMEPHLDKFNVSAEENEWITRSREKILAQKEAVALRQAEELESARNRAEEAERLKNEAEQGRKRARTFSYVTGLVAAFAIIVGGYAFRQRQYLLTITEKVAESILKDANLSIYGLNYDDAQSKISNAAQLGAKKEEVGRAFMEIAFFYSESGQWGKAIPAAVNAAKMFDNDMLRDDFEKSDTVTVNAHTEFRKILKKLDAIWYDSLEYRYYPVLVEVKGGSFNFQNKIITQVNDFEIANTEVTFWQFGLYCASTHQDIKKYAPNWGIDGNNPVVNITWYDAIEYSNWVSNQLGLSLPYSVNKALKDENNQGIYDTKKWTVVQQSLANCFRLPTEIEWEYAARSGQVNASYQYSGSDTLSQVGWYIKNSEDRTHPTADKKPNNLGLYDMSGNVWEWCWDWYRDLPASSFSNLQAPIKGSYRVLRGGSYHSNDVNECRVLNRNINQKQDRFTNHGYLLCGFRLVKSN